jgi:hypothetical protein
MPNRLVSVVPDAVTRALICPPMYFSRASRARTSARWSRATCSRTAATSSAGRIRASRAWALFAVSSRRIPPGVSSASSRCSRHTAWVRCAVSSSRRPQQPQAHRHVVAGHLEYAGALQGGQADRDRVMLVGLAAVPAGVHPDPGGQLSGDVQHQFPVSGQPVGRRPARAVASFHRPPPLRPPPRERGQLLIAVGAVSEPGRVDQGLAHRAGTAAVLLALCGSTAIITSSFKGFLLAIGFSQARRAMQLTAAQTSLEPQPRRESRTSRGPFVSQNTQGDGSRFASEPAPLNARESQIPELPETI